MASTRPTSISLSLADNLVTWNERIIAVEFGVNKPDAAVVKSDTYLGFDPDEIPPITDFLKTPSKDDKQSQSRVWIDQLLKIATGVADKSGMSVVIAEISVLTDVLSPQSESEDQFFTTNIVCPIELVGLGNEEPILKAYLSAIKDISREGTTINIPEFHELHFVHVRRPIPATIQNLPFSGSISSFRENIQAQRLAWKYIKGSQEIDFKLHHRNFFDHFLQNWHSEWNPNLPDFIDYLAIPFRRPEHLMLLTNADHSARLTPAGAMYLILRPSKHNPDLESHRANIETIASQLQYICVLSCLKASSLLGDVSEARLMAYDGIGHALRAFVEATKYAGANELLSDVQHDNRLPEDLVRPIAHVRRSLAFFEHVEALGSLMRLHGWLLARSAGFNKVLECFNEEDVQEIRESRYDGNLIVTAAAEVISSIASPLAYKDDVTFRIRHKGTQNHDIRTIEIGPEIEVSGQVSAQLTIPPLRGQGDRRAVLLALMVALVEPLRNASMYLKAHEAVGDAASMVEVWIEGKSNGVVEIFIGNRWNGVDAANVDLSILSTGIRLVHQLLKECCLGWFFKTTLMQLKAESIPINAWDGDYDDYVWIGIHIDPLALYDVAKGGA